MIPWRAFWSSWPFRALAAATLLKLLFRLSGSAVRSTTLVSLVDTIASVTIAATLGYILIRLLVVLQRRLLWRVRRKLVISYVFIGFIPVVLVVSFFVLAGTLSLLSVSSFLVRLQIDELVGEAGAVAGAVRGQLVSREAVDARVVLRRQVEALAERHPEASLAVVMNAGAGVAAGRWGHGGPPATIPSWIVPSGFTGLVAVRDVSDASLRLVARAVVALGVDLSGGSLVVDLPLGAATTDRLWTASGIELEAASVFLLDDSIREETDGVLASTLTSDGALNWISFLEHTDWTSGQLGFLNLQIRVSPSAFYEHVLGSQARIGDVSLGYAFLVALALVGVLFLVIEFAALVMGFALARSITGSVHELFVGTEHVRRGDFAHRITVTTKDQLGELAESFNAMTSSVKDLLKQAAEKKRLEEELRIAREIQMSLLPCDVETLPGLGVTAVCIPAREVGGDYYDFVRLSDDRMGVLVADVSGKGTSAAFYMAELKGLILALSQVHHSPKRLLIEVNRILAPTIDNRSFITMTYAVIDLQERTLTYARAGHTPLIYVSTSGEVASAQVLVPNGLVVGLNIQGFETAFEDILEERTITIRSGDVAVLYTDGITEAMNEEDDLFGEDRLSRLVAEHAGLSSDDLHERILRGVEAFVGSADQHDDMTMVLLKFEMAPVGDDALATTSVSV